MQDLSKAADIAAQGIGYKDKRKPFRLKAFKRTIGTREKAPEFCGIACGRIYDGLPLCKIPPRTARAGTPNNGNPSNGVLCALP